MQQKQQPIKLTKTFDLFMALVFTVLVGVTVNYISTVMAIIKLASVSLRGLV